MTTTSYVPRPEANTRYGGKSWAKHVTGVDLSQRGGYALLGDFLDRGKSVGIPAGDHVVTFDQKTNSRGRVKLAESTVYRVDASGELIELTTATGDDWAHELATAIETDREAGEAPEVELSDAERQIAAALSDLSPERRAAVIAAAQEV